jgi:CheY-like chemotaxis protein
VTFSHGAAHTIEVWEDLERRNDAPQLVLVDQHLADHDGLWVAERLRDRLEDVTPLIAPAIALLVPLGAHPTPAEALAAGCCCVISKPVKRDMLLKLLSDRSTGVPSKNTPNPLPDGPGGDAQGMRVLVVEDNLVNQKLTVHLLKKFGIFSSVAGNGIEALDSLRTADFDIVLMDCQMPELDGYAATQRIRAGDAGERAKSLPIIALTAHALISDRDRCILAGMSDYLTKPVDPASLRAMLEKHAGWRAHTEANS